jgi:hypothetical protein
MFRISTGLQNSVLGDASLKGASLAYVDNGASEDQITDSENRFLTAGFKVGDKITTTGSTTAGNDISEIVLTAVAQGALSFATGVLAASEAFLAGTIVTGSNGGSWKSLLDNGIIHVYSGTQPASADDAETGTLLLKLTVASGAFVAGSPDNGLSLRQIISGVMVKDDGEVWSGVGLATGTAGWFRYYANDYVTGASNNAIRFDGTVGTSGAQLILTSTNIVLGATTTADSCKIIQPAA